MVGSASTTAMAVMRPPMFAGPTQRQFIFLAAESGISPAATEVVSSCPFLSDSSFFWRLAICFSTSAISFLMSSSLDRAAAGRMNSSTAKAQMLAARPGRMKVHTDAALKE